MKKSLRLVLSGFVLLILTVNLGAYSNAVYDTAQCISTFEGQSSFVCRIGGSSAATIVLQGLFFTGLVLIVIGAVQYFKKRKTL